MAEYKVDNGTTRLKHQWNGPGSESKYDVDFGRGLTAKGTMDSKGNSVTQYSNGLIVCVNKGKVTRSFADGYSG